jgi:hypothetical protein
MLPQGVQVAGLPTDLWPCPRVAWLIQRRFGVQYHHAHVSRLHPRWIDPPNISTMRARSAKACEVLCRRVHSASRSLSSSVSIIGLNCGLCRIAPLKVQSNVGHRGRINIQRINDSGHERYLFTDGDALELLHRPWVGARCDRNTDGGLCMPLDVRLGRAAVWFAPC